MTVEQSDGACAPSFSSAELACDGCKRLKAWAESAWARGHAMGMQENKRIAREATAALEAEKEAHAETNVRLTEALMMAEEQLAQMQANAALTGAAKVD